MRRWIDALEREAATAISNGELPNASDPKDVAFAVNALAVGANCAYSSNAILACSSGRAERCVWCSAPASQTALAVAPALQAIDPLRGRRFRARVATRRLDGPRAPVAGGFGEVRLAGGDPCRMKIGEARATRPAARTRPRAPPAVRVAGAKGARPGGSVSPPGHPQRRESGSNPLPSPTNRRATDRTSRGAQLIIFPPGRATLRGRFPPLRPAGNVDNVTLGETSLSRSTFASLGEANVTLDDANRIECDVVRTASTPVAREPPRTTPSPNCHRPRGPSRRPAGIRAPSHLHPRRVAPGEQSLLGRGASGPAPSLHSTRSASYGAATSDLPTLQIASGHRNHRARLGEVGLAVAEIEIHRRAGLSVDDCGEDRACRGRCPRGQQSMARGEPSGHRRGVHRRGVRHAAGARPEDRVGGTPSRLHALNVGRVRVAVFGPPPTPKLPGPG